MGPDLFYEAVARRNARLPGGRIGGFWRDRLGHGSAVAESGVDRISVGALTHSAVSLDFGLDWQQVVGGSACV